MEYVILVIAVVGIVFGADYLVAGAVSIAKKFKVSDFVIGAAIVGIGTSAPELCVSFIGALQGNSDVAIGNVVGSNIFNVFGILGLTAMVSPIVVNKDNIKFELPVCIGISILLVLLSNDLFTRMNTEGWVPNINWIDGLILLTCFVGFMGYSFYRDKKKGTLADQAVVLTAAQAQTDLPKEKETAIWLDILKVIGGLTLLVLSCDIFVDNAVIIAKSWGVNDAFISLTLIACGTSLPELAASVAAAVKKNTQLALGNIVGSNIFNIALILGLSSQVTPLTSSSITLIDYSVVVLAAVLPLLFCIDRKISRSEGLILFAGFIGYNWYLLNTQMVG